MDMKVHAKDLINCSALTACSICNILTIIATENTFIIMNCVKCQPKSNIHAEGYFQIKQTGF